MASFSRQHFKCIFLNENFQIPIKISLEFVPTINNILALVQIMAWHRAGDKPLSEPMMVRLLMHLYASLGLNNLKSYCSVEGYFGSLDRAHDLLTDVCDDHVFW